MDVYNRSVEFLDLLIQTKLKNQKKKFKILIVSHGGFIMEFFNQSFYI